MTDFERHEKTTVDDLLYGLEIVYFERIIFKYQAISVNPPWQ